MIEEVLEKLQAAKLYTVMDFKNRYFHLPVEKSSRATFVTREGLFEFNKLPFGFRKSPAAASSTIFSQIS